MKKRFKTSKKIHKHLFLVFVVIFLFTFFFLFSLASVYKKIVTYDNSLVVSLLLKDSFGSINVENLKILKDPVFLIRYGLGQNLNVLNKVENEDVSKEVINIESEPILYIYNTHQTEMYSNNSLEPFNIAPSVITADYILKEYMEEYGVKTIVEEKSVSDILYANNWKYGYSYKASRMLLESAKLSNPSLSYFIDLHRDSGNKNSTTVEINGKNYAKVLFVVGLEHAGYNYNLEFANSLNEKIKINYPTLTRGIMKKSGPGVNGIYNQDFDSRCILIEVGGPMNTLEEINNTLFVVAQVLNEYIGDDYGT